jgi:hypothetical protein
MNAVRTYQALGRLKMTELDSVLDQVALCYYQAGLAAYHYFRDGQTGDEALDEERQNNPELVASGDPEAWAGYLMAGDEVPDALAHISSPEDSALRFQRMAQRGANGSSTL